MAPFHNKFIKNINTIYIKIPTHRFVDNYLIFCLLLDSVTTVKPGKANQTSFLIPFNVDMIPTDGVSGSHSLLVAP